VRKGNTVHFFPEFEAQRPMKQSFVSFFVSVSVVLILLAVGISPAQAQARFGLEGCFGEDIDFGLGARMRMDLGYARGLALTGAFDYFFPDVEQLTYFEVSGLVTYAFSVANAPAAPYAGGGLTLGRASADFGSFSGSNSEIMPTLVGGFNFATRRGWKPYVELRLELSGYEQFVLTGGVLF
jgi:hypothetical protein